jgi:hypothetical protein
MHPFLYLVVALTLGQAEPAEAPADATPPPAAQDEPQAQPTSPPAETPAQAPAEPAPRPRPSPRPRPAPATPSAPDAQAPAAAGAKPAAPPPAPPPATQRPPEAERAQVARAALAFLDALVRGDAARLAAASGERFSLDGEVRTGRDQIERAFRELLSARGEAPPGALLDLELLPAADAVARLGPPPARVAPLAAARGGWVAIADVSRRPVVLFLAREGQRWAVAGME